MVINKKAKPPHSKSTYKNNLQMFSSLSNFYLFILFALFISHSPLFSKELELLQTKQDPFNIIYLSNDGLITYYQALDGRLSLSKNYLISTVLQGEKNSRYSIIGSPHHRKLLIVQDETIHTAQNLRKSKKIYQTEYGLAQARPLGKGSYPKLHLNDLWASFYIFEEYALYFVNLDSPALNFKIILQNNFNPYFIPEHLMISPEIIYYTAQNKQGETAIFEFNRQTQKHTQIFKTHSYKQRVELCYVNQTLYLGRFPFDHTELGSSIETLMRPIYQSQNDDLGHMICTKEGIYFIKNYTGTDASVFKDTFFDIAFLDFNSLKTQRRTNLRFITNMTEMDENIYIPFEGKIYVLSGKNTFLETLHPTDSSPSTPSTQNTQRRTSETSTSSLPNTSTSTPAVTPDPVSTPSSTQSPTPPTSNSTNGPSSQSSSVKTQDLSTENDTPIIRPPVGTGI